MVLHKLSGIEPLTAFFLPAIRAAAVLTMALPPSGYEHADR
jgi:hypothetical protein